MRKHKHIAYDIKRKVQRKRSRRPFFFLFYGVVLCFLIVPSVVILKNALTPSLLFRPVPIGTKTVVTHVLPNDTKQALRDALLRKNISVQGIEMSSGSAMLVTMTSGEEVLFSKEKSFEKQISSLQFILSRITIEGKRFSRLDLRFEKPVITMSE